MAFEGLGWLGSVTCGFCWAGLGFLLPKDREHWAKAFASVNEDWTNRIRDLHRPDVRKILQKLVGKCVKYGLNSKKEETNNLIKLSYWDKKSEDCDWEKEGEDKSNLMQQELETIEKICENELWETLNGNNLLGEYKGKRLVNYNWCLNFAVKKMKK